MSLNLQISASHGPQECQLAVKEVLKVLLMEAEQRAVNVEILEEIETKFGYLSVILKIEDTADNHFKNEWVGSVQCSFKSPFRVTQRKNWFIGISELKTVDNLLNKAPINLEDIEFKSCKASGPGGQHVNKTQSAIQATHLKSGLSVKVSSQRSQFSNKKEAIELLQIKLAQQEDLKIQASKKTNNQQHWNVQRGDPVKIITVKL